jgi:hypothetical protein
VWWIEKRLLLEREMACDDAVLERTGRPRAYAQCLVTLAEKSIVRRGIALAQAVISRAHETSLRLEQILDLKRPKAGGISRPAMITLTAFAAGCLALRPELPRLVAFQGPPAMQSAEAPAAWPSLPQAVVVPASVREAAPVVQEKTQIAAIRKPRTWRQPQASLLAKNRPAREAARVVPASVKQQPASPDLVVVMQTAEFNADGAAIFRLTVWQVSFAHGKRPPVADGSVAKSL